MKNTIAITLFLCLKLLQPSAVQAEFLDLATMPLQTSGSSDVKPNLMFILDNSGSMGFEYTPDWAEHDPDPTHTYRVWSGSRWQDVPLDAPDRLFSNSAYNTQFYNPEITYTTPLNYQGVSQANRTSYSSLSKTARVYETDAAGNNIFITRGASAYYFAYVPGEYCTTPALTNCKILKTQTAEYKYPSQLRWCNDSVVAKKRVLQSTNGIVDKCQGIRNDVPTGGYTYTALREPLARYRVTFNISGNVRVTSIKINNIEILSATTPQSSNSTTVASEVRNNICTKDNPTGNCNLGRNVVSASGSRVTITTLAGDPVNAANPVQVTFSGSGGSYSAEQLPVNASDIPGSLVYQEIKSSQTSYTAPGSAERSLERTDCAGKTCNYSEEFTNFANWATYYRTRLLAMKTAASQAFKGLDARYRVGFVTINDPNGNYLKLAPFNLDHKEKWYNALFSASANGGTPLRSTLAKVGRHYGGKESFGARGAEDPMQFACQQNFALLTTDGYWNDNTSQARDILDLKGSLIGNLDGKGTPTPQLDSADATRTLADVAKYFYDTDIRDSTFSNCSITGGVSVCGAVNDYEKQNMITMTLGLGIDGTLVYTDDYKTQTVGDFQDLTTGAKGWPDPTKEENGTRIDDLWHAAVNAGGTYYSASNPKLLRESLVKGLSEIKSVQGAAAAAAASSLAPTDGDNFQYVASYQTVKWIGNLEARTVNVSTLDTSEAAVWCVENVAAETCSSTATQYNGPNGKLYCKTINSSEDDCKGTNSSLGSVLGFSEPASCYVEIAKSCTGRMQEQVAKNNRKIYFNLNNALVPFVAGNLPAGHRDSLANGYLALSQIQGLPKTDPKVSDANKVNKLVDYLRGNKTYEDISSNSVAANRLFRERQATLGDISQSRPAYFKVSNAGYLDAGYKKYKTDMAARTPAVYVGANDGMLHAFNANTGDELWAFIPTPAIENLANLADKEYGSSYHTNYVNGNPVVADVCISGCSGTSAVWRTILVAGLNGGGRGYFAIDVTSPENPVLLWEFYASSLGNNNLGYTFGNPVVTKMQNGRWVVLVTSGYNNGNYARKLNDGKFANNTPAGDGAGYLYVLDAVTGVLVRDPISTGEGSPSEPSGLSKIAAYAEQMFENNTALNVYGGDLNGYIYRFDINTGVVKKIAVLKDSKGNIQKMTTQPELGKVDKNRVVLVGTGKFLEPADLTNTPVNSVYAIKDNGQSAAVDRRNLIEQVLSSDRKVSATDVSFDNTYGWLLDFPAGERVNLDPLLLNGVLLMPTLVPTSQACSGAGYGWFNYFNYKKGNSILPSGIVSERMVSPAVGYNVVYDGKNVPHIVVTGSNDPTPQQLSLDDQVFGISGTGKTGNIFKQKSNGSYGTKQSWRELIQ